MSTTCENAALLDTIAADIDIWYGALCGYYNQTLYIVCGT